MNKNKIDIEITEEEIIEDLGIVIDGTVDKNLIDISSKV